MNNFVIKIENISKRYKLGSIGSRTLIKEISGKWARHRGKPDPNSKIDFLSNEKKDYNRITQVWALKDVNLNIKPGETLGIIGKNGAGKSTLLKILSQITSPTEGLIKVKGKIGALLEVGTGFHPELTGKENIFLNGAILGMDKKEISAKLNEIIEFSGIQKYIDTPVKRYSSGMRVRLAFSVAAHLDPDILLVDEVLAVGDAEFQKKCLGKMNEVANVGRTILFVSHNLGAIKNLCSKVILIENGKIKFKGNPQQAIDIYLKTHSKNNQIFNGQKFWKREDAPGDNGFKLLSVELANSNGEPTRTININDSFSISISYKLEEKVKDSRIIIYFKSRSGEIAFCTSNHNLMKTQIGMRSGGFNSKCIIPKNLLNNINYQIDIHVDIPRIKRVFQYIGKIEIDTYGDTSNSSGYNEKVPGILSPRIDWKIQPKSFDL